MPLQSGSRLGPYEILSPLGTGGMGEVYRARDHRLDRDIALKLLPDDVAADPVRRARFEREAKALAAADHSATVTVHSIEEIEGRTVLTMELVEGRTLADAIPAGGFRLEQLLRLAIPIAEGLAFAHRRGVIHRDLKPGNVMVATDGTVRILDFGLARLRTGNDGARETGFTPTLTQEGAALGTPAYMSPEQIRGQAADERSDIFALGTILYQMATGDRPFSGATTPELMSSILKDEPVDPSQRQPSVPRQFDRIVRHCLNKDPERRFQTAIDVANELRDLKDETEPTVSVVAGKAQPARESHPVAIITWGFLVLLVGLLIYFGFRHPSDRVPIDEGAGSGDSTAGARLSQLAVGAGLEEWAAWSPDGSSVVYTAEVDGFKNLHLRDVAAGSARRLTRSRRDELQPAWGSEGDNLYFVRADEAGGKLSPGDVLSWFARDGDIWRIEIPSGQETLVFEGGFNPDLDAAGRRLAFDSNRGGPRRIWTTDPAGRNPRQVSTDESEFVAHVDPSWSPDARHIVFRRAGGVESDIYALELDSGESWAITDDGFLDMDPVWSPDGRWIYFSSYRGGGLNLWRMEVSTDGRARGVAQQVTTGAGHDLQVAVSPDSDSVVFTVLQQNTDLWRLPVDPRSGAAAGPAEILVATTREDSRGAWAPDSTRIAFNSDRRGDMNLWLREADGSEVPLTAGPGGDYQPFWSPDGESIAFFSSRSGNGDIWTVHLPSGQLTQLTTSGALDINPSYSPDGQWIAFESDRDGRLEPWLMRADGSDRRRIADIPATVHYLVWWPDGLSVFFRSQRGADQPIVRVQIDNGEVARLPPVRSGAHMSLSPDGSLILDVDVHKTLKVFPVDGSEPREVFAFDDPASRIDYPRWSPDGGAVLFDRADPQGADLWMLRGL